LSASLGFLEHVEKPFSNNWCDCNCYFLILLDLFFDNNSIFIRDV